jgi:hypothetical protein
LLNVSISWSVVVSFTKSSSTKVMDYTVSK